MKVLLIDQGKKGFPNLALMKISAWHKSKGDTVQLNRINNPDKIYVSCPFKRPIQNLSIALSDKPIVYGGYGINSNKLSDEIEFLMPDYSLYNIDYSIGFTSRGCINKCPFCVVPKYEGMIKDHQFVSEFLYPKHKKVILLDNSFTNSPRFKENSKYLIKNKIKVNINQGIDVRTITLEQAKILNKLMLRNWTFKSTQLHIAWDNIKDEKLVRRGIKILLKAGFRSRYLMCYVLVNFNSTFEEDLYRCNMLWKEYKVLPFIMSYKGKHPLQRWANRRYIKFTDWQNYDQAKTH